MDNIRSFIPILPSQLGQKNPDLSVAKTRILFYHANSTHMGNIWLYPTALFLKTYIDLSRPDLADRLEWLVPLPTAVDDQALIDHLSKHEVDILCTSHYLWNDDFLINQLSSIKHQISPAVKIIAGGPNVDVNINPEFFNQCPHIDYAIYGPGERAFADIVSHLVLETPLIADQTSNCAWYDHDLGQTVVADYEFVKLSDTSPYLHCKDLLVAMTAEAKRDDPVPWLCYSLTRGCPYACTFCDWNSGLGNKVSRRKNTYQQEIDLFYDLGLFQVHLTDANVGQYDEDVEMIAYLAEKNLTSPSDQQFHIGGSYSKLNKKNNLKIFKMLLEANLVRGQITFAAQDINQQVLINIDRPDVGWDVHVAMADEIRNEHPGAIVNVQLIYGLPGQTPASWRQTLVKVLEARMVPSIFVNQPLSASPAMSDPEYQRRWQYEYVESRTIFSHDHDTFLRMWIPKKCTSFDQKDMVEMTVISNFALILAYINAALPKDVAVLDLSDILIGRFLDSQIYKNLCDDFYNNWVMNGDFFSTVDFAGKPTHPYNLISNISNHEQNISLVCDMIKPVLSEQRRQSFHVHTKNRHFISQASILPTLSSD